MRLIKPVGLPPLMVVSFGVARDLEVAFNDFYHNQFLPQLFTLSPQLRSIKRFEKYDTDNSMTRDDGDFLTFYELDCEETLDKTDAIFGHSQFAQTLAKFRQHKEAALTNFSRVNYQPIHRDERVPEGAGLATPSFSCCYLTYFELSKDGEERFLDWYLGQYQPQVFLTALDLLACHSYKIYDPNQALAPAHLLTVYEAADDQTMTRALAQLSGAGLGSNTATWQKYCGNSTVVRLETTTVRSIFALP